MEEKLSKEKCIRLLQEKSVEIKATGSNLYPKKADFTNEQVVAIKSFLGPWPRALEAAGIKEPSLNTTHQHTVDKRIRLKRERIARLKQQKNTI